MTIAHDTHLNIAALAVHDLASAACQALDALAVEDLTDDDLYDVFCAARDFVTDALAEERRRGIDFGRMEADAWG